MEFILEEWKAGPIFSSNEMVTPRDIIVYNSDSESLRCDKLVDWRCTSNNYTGVHAGIAYKQAVKVHIRKKGAKST